MKREIKFRGWHPSIEEMFYFDMWIPWEAECSMGNSYYTKNMEIMQYTGFKDKNGKEIYEEDVFEIGGQNYSVEFRDGCYFVGHLVLATTIDHREVIGNIYENPELIK